MYGYYRKKLYMIITSENERVNWFSEKGNLIVIRKKEQERERVQGWGEEEVYIHAGEALIIQNVCMY